MISACGAIFSSSYAADGDDPQEVDWPNFVLEHAAFGAGQVATHITHSGDASGRLFVVDVRGNIRVLQNGEFIQTPFLGIQDRVLAGGERGLFSVAFDAGFESNGVFYVDYTRRPDGATVISRFRAEPGANTVDPASEQVLLVIPQPFANHNGGQIAFGPDGYLYIGMGDGGGQGDPGDNGQNPQSLLGKMLRIDVSGSSTNYSVPPTNPFVGRSEVRPEIWAAGLRNPWRFSFDRQTGDLFIADVGEGREEEINFQSASSAGGENYGWRIYEGTLPFRSTTNAPWPGPLTFPVATYGRAFGRSITGGHVIRTSPSERTYGVYIYADFISGRLGALKQVGTNWLQADFGKPRIADLPGPTYPTVPFSSFGEDEAGNLYALANGVVYKLVDEKAVHTPMFSPTGRVYAAEQTITLTTLTPRARIHYTADGSDPTETSPSVASGESFLLTESATVKARAFRSDLAPSLIASQRYTLQVSFMATPGTGPVTNGTAVTLDTAVSNVVFRYTLDGTAPTEASPLYASPIVLEGNQNLRVTASRPGWTSAETNIFYGLLIPEWVTIQDYAGGGTNGVADAPARAAHFTRPISLAINPAGELFVGELGARETTLDPGGPTTVRKIATNGLVTTVWTNFGWPTAMVSDTDGNIFIGSQNAVLKGTPGAALELYHRGARMMPRAIRVDDTGNTYVIDNQAVLVSTRSGDLLYYRSLWEGADLGLIRAPDTTLLFGGYYGLFYFNAEDQPVPYAGGVFSEYGSGHSDGPRLRARFDAPGLAYELRAQFRPLAYDGAGNLLVADAYRVRKINTNGIVSTLIDRPPGQPRSKIGTIVGMAVHPNGDVFVIDMLDSKVKRISPDSDRDSVADPDEQEPFSLGRDDRLIDTDGDAASNAAEYLAGSDPLSSLSVPRLQVEAGDTELKITWNTVAKGTVVLEQSSDLKDWTPLIIGFSGTITLQQTSDRIFFRARIE